MAENNPDSGTTLARNAMKEYYETAGQEAVRPGAYVNFLPTTPLFLYETVHILPYSKEERVDDWLTKWRKRNTNDYMDSWNNLDNFLNGLATTSYVLTTKNKELYNSENGKYKYNSKYDKFEIYHPAVFSNPTMVWEKAYASGNRTINGNSIRIIEPQSEKQYYFKENDKEHTRRMEIATKAALMLYRSKDVNNDSPDFGLEQAQVRSQLIRKFDNAKAKYKNAQIAYQQNNLLAYYNAVVAPKQNVYNSAQNALASFLSPYKHLSNDVFNALNKMGSADALLPDSLSNPYRDSSCYGLWGKWYNSTTGFHRGIDINFGNGTPFYSVCAGTVKHLQRSIYEDTDDGVDEWSHLTIKIISPEEFSGKYLTYMHAKFEEFSEGEHIRSGEKIGIEKDYMGGVRAFHTHIELNHSGKGSFDTNSFAQAKEPRSPIGSLNPYLFLECCFRDFMRGLHNPDA